MLGCAFTQKIGIALTGLGKFDNPRGDHSLGVIVCKPKSYFRVIANAAPRTCFVSGSTLKPFRLKVSMVIVASMPS